MQVTLCLQDAEDHWWILKHTLWGYNLAIFMSFKNSFVLWILHEWQFCLLWQNQVDFSKSQEVKFSLRKTWTPSQALPFRFWNGKKKGMIKSQQAIPNLLTPCKSSARLQRSQREIYFLSVESLMSFTEH